MKRLRFPACAILLGTVCLPLAAPSLAADPPPDPVVVRGDDGETITLDLSDGQLRVVTDRDGRTSTAVVDLDAIGAMVDGVVSDAVRDLDQVLAAIGGMQLQVRLGEDNRLNLSYDQTEMELDLDEIVAQVAEAVRFGVDEIDAERWYRKEPLGTSRSEAELRRELKDLQREMKELRRELRRLQDVADE